MSCAETPGRDHHGTAMDRIYRVQRHVYDLTRKYYLLGRDRLIDSLNPPPGAIVCEPGCGTGRNLILAARRYPEARFYGIDASAEMLKSAERSIRRAGLADRITVARGLAESFDPKALFDLDRGFDLVFLSYTLSMVPDWRQAVDRAFAVTAPGGRVLVVDFGDQGRLPVWFRRALFAWLSRFSVTPRTDLPPVFETRAARDGARAEAAALYRGYAHMLSARRRDGAAGAAGSTAATAWARPADPGSNGWAAHGG